MILVVAGAVVFGLGGLAACTSDGRPSDRFQTEPTGPAEGLGSPERVPEVEAPAKPIVLRVIDIECRNIAELTIDGQVWRLDDLLPLDWKGLEEIDGNFVAADDTIGVFSSGEVKLRMTTGTVKGGCSLWPPAP